MEFALKQIIIWRTASIPDGWALCNGQTVGGIVTPNLVGKYVKGANADGDLKTIAGETEHHHSYANPATDSKNNHGHNVSPSWSNSGLSSDKAPTSSGIDRAGNHNHTASLSVVAAGAHTHTLGDTEATANELKRITLPFIMKVT